MSCGQSIPCNSKTPKTSERVQSLKCPETEIWRRRCGCIKTSEKLKKILSTFPSTPPTTPTIPTTPTKLQSSSPQRADNDCCSKPRYYLHTFAQPQYEPMMEMKKQQSRSAAWQVVAEIVQLVQLSVTATALALYYLIYCYMQLIYLTLRSALYFHNADMPMKITIGVVTLTSVVVGFNLLLRIERILGVVL